MNWAAGLYKRENSVDIKTRANEVVKFDYCGNGKFPGTRTMQNTSSSVHRSNKKEHKKKNQKTYKQTTRDGIRIILRNNNNNNILRSGQIRMKKMNIYARTHIGWFIMFVLFTFFQLMFSKCSFSKCFQMQTYRLVNQKKKIVFHSIKRKK